MKDSSKFFIRDLDFALICKLSKALNISPKNWEKIMANEDYGKRENELSKFILKSTLPTYDDVVYRIREQKYGGFSITLAGPLFEKIVHFINHRNIMTELNAFYSQTDRNAEFSEIYEEWINFTNRDYLARLLAHVNYKDDVGIYIRITPGNCYHCTRNSEYSLLYTKLLNLISAVNKFIDIARKLIEFENSVNYEDINPQIQNAVSDASDLVAVPNDYVFSQLASIF